MKNKKKKDNLMEVGRDVLFGLFLLMSYPILMTYTNNVFLSSGMWLIEYILLQNFIRDTN
jgi:hypothetical protein